jgi:mycothione reductase
VRAEEVKENGNGVTVTVRDDRTDRKKDFTARRVLVAVGRRSNADTLQADRTGVALDKKGFITVNDYLETSQKNIYAVGDINGRQMFTHVANAEAALAAHNALHGSRLKMDYNATPHAVYSHPEIAAVGMREEEARKAHRVLVGKAKYSSVAKGEAMMEENGFAKAIVEAKTEQILGFHIIGPYAPILIQEVINVIAAKGNVNHLQTGMHIHPALPELIIKTLSNLESPA